MATSVFLRKNIFNFARYRQSSGCIRLCCESYYNNAGPSRSSQKRKSKYASSYRTLELPDDSSREAVRRQYIELVKKYHPDATKDPSDKFSEIDKAYRTLLSKFKEDKEIEEASIGEYGLYYKGEEVKMEDESDDDIDHPDIRHPAPQHRQYLEHGGFGYGTPAQRQKQHQKYRAFRANEAVFEHRMGKVTAQYEDRIATRERKTIKKHSTRNQIDRLVEDLIQESIASGEFDNLSGVGKPLPERVDYNPYSDYTTHKMNQIMAEGGFAPEWVMLRKTIYDEFESIRSQLKKKRSEMGNQPFSQDKLKEWEKLCKILNDGEVKGVNKKISNYNLIVPMLHSQMFQFDMDKECKKILNSPSDSPEAPGNETTESLDTNIKQGKPETSIWSDLMDSLFKSR